MKRTVAVILVLSVVTMVCVTGIQADPNASNPPLHTHNESLPKTMKKAYHYFKRLQPYLYDRASFEDAENEKEITSLLENLKGNFHTLDTSNTGYENDPTFRASLSLAEELIDSSVKQFKDGNKSWVLWRLRTLSNHCYSCHATHEIDVSFHDTATEEKLPANPLVRAEFYLASRQFDKASKEFLNAAITADETEDRLDPLRKWLFITVRISSDPRIAMQELKHVIESVSLTAYEVKIIKAWLTSLRDWKKEGPAPRVDVATAEDLITRSTSLHDPAFSATGSVELLRATGILHRVLENESVSNSDHQKALYLLGLAYSKIPQFFINELPEVYLEQIIRTYPGTEAAADSYELYEDIILEGFTGSGGTNVPDDVQKTLDTLKTLAEGDAHASATK